MTMIGGYVIFWTVCSFLDVVWLKRCEERPLVIVIDSTNLTSREDFEVQLSIANNVTAQLRHGVDDVDVKANIFQYNRNDICRMHLSSPCVMLSSNVTMSLKGVRSLSGLMRSNQSQRYYKFANQQYCLECAELIRAELMSEFGRESFGIILATHQSLKKYIPPEDQPKYKKGIAYYLALLYNSNGIKSRDPIARRLSQVDQIVDKILSAICPNRFQYTPKKTGSDGDARVTTVARTATKTTSANTTSGMTRQTVTSSKMGEAFIPINASPSVNIMLTSTPSTLVASTRTTEGRTVTWEKPAISQPTARILNETTTTTIKTTRETATKDNMLITKTASGETVATAMRSRYDNDITTSHGSANTHSLIIASPSNTERVTLATLPKTTTSSIPQVSSSSFLPGVELPELPGIAKNYTVTPTKSWQLNNFTATLVTTPSTFTTQVYKNITSVAQNATDVKIGKSTDMPIVKVSKSNARHTNYSSDVRKTRPNETGTSMMLKPSMSTEIYANNTVGLGKTKGEEQKTLAITSSRAEASSFYGNITTVPQTISDQRFNLSTLHSPVSTGNSTVAIILKPTQALTAYKNLSYFTQTPMDKKLDNSAVTFLTPSRSSAINTNYTFDVEKTRNETLKNVSVLTSKYIGISDNGTFVINETNTSNASRDTGMNESDTFFVRKTLTETMEISTAMPMLVTVSFNTGRGFNSSTDVLDHRSSTSNATYKSSVSVTPRTLFGATVNSTHASMKTMLASTQGNNKTYTSGSSISTGNLGLLLISNSSVTASAMSQMVAGSINFTNGTITKSSFINYTALHAPRSSIYSENSSTGMTRTSVNISGILITPLVSHMFISANATVDDSKLQSNMSTSILKSILTSTPQIEKTDMSQTPSIWSYLSPTSSISSYTHRTSTSWSRMSSVTVNRSIHEMAKTYDISPSLWSQAPCSSSFSSVVYPPKDVKIISDIKLFMEQNITRLHVKKKWWITDFIKNTSIILNEIVRENENDTREEKSFVREKSLDFFEFVGSTTMMIGRQLPVGRRVNVTTDELVIEISAFDPLTFTGYVFVPEPNADNTQQQQHIQLSANLFKNTSITQKVAVTSLFMDTLPAMRKSSDSFMDVGKVFTISVDAPLQYPIEKTLTYRLRAPENNFSNYKCVFWNSTGDWDTTGCHVTGINGTTVTCECDHLTSFSVLMQISEFETHSAHAYALSIISYIGCSISIAGCILLMLVYLMCGRLLKVSRNVIHMNLALAMAISNGLFICADSVHMYNSLCLTVSIAMLYSYLASFFWMLVEGLHVYLMIVKVFKSPNMMKVYFIIGWVLPAVIVTVAGMKYHVNFTRDDFCWISTDGNVIWVFVGPVLFIIAVNSAILTKALTTSYKMAVAETAFLKFQETARLTILLMPIFGLTWVFGLLAINKQWIMFQYLFTISNSLQGLYVFVCYCVLNNEVKQEFERVRRKYQYGSGQSSTTESNNGNFSVYNQLFNKRAKKSIISIDGSNMVKLTRYDSVETESTSPSRTPSTQYSSLAKRINKYPIELINLNESMSFNDDVNRINEVEESLSASSSFGPEEHDYGLKLKYEKYEEVPLTNGYVVSPPVYLSSDELSNSTCTYDTFKRVK